MFLFLLGIVIFKRENRYFHKVTTYNEKLLCTIMWPSLFSQEKVTSDCLFYVMKNKINQAVHSVVESSIKFLNKIFN